MTTFGYAFSANQAEAISEYAAELVSMGMDEGNANTKATNDVNALVASMKGGQSSADYAFTALEERVDNLLENDLRKEKALNALERVKDEELIGEDSGVLVDFLKMDPADYIYVQKSIGGAPPRVTEGDAFRLAREAVEEAQSRINRILIAPTRPGAVPTGDIVSDFIPQIIRQLFRFAWVAVLLAFTASGIMFIVAHGNDERLTKAKSMLYFTLIGFAFIAMAFAIVKAVTDIDFFRFI
jgi:hypothetical protein